MTQRDGNGIAMYYNRDVQGRIVARFKNTLTNWSAAAAGDYYYGYTASGDTPDFVRDVNWNVLEKNLELPGGVLLTIRPQQTGNAQKQYSLPNIHGDVLLTTDAAGTNTSNGNGPASTFTYDPFGNILSGSTLPSNADHASYGYVGQHEKLTESEYATTPMQMGARVYIPGIGRFLQVDPEEGGTPNNYVYPPDPINDFDLTGNFGMKSFANIASVGSMIPGGPIGMASAAVSAAAYAAAGDKKNAVIMTATVAAAAVGAGAAVKMAQAAKAGKEFKSTMALGRQAHKVFQVKHKTGEIPLGALGRADGFVKGKIVELKPHNTRAMSQGMKQLTRYTGGDLRKGALWTYKKTMFGNFKFKCRVGCR
jgi:RHS repeat-associated protein